ncbi:hypothetical protein ACP4OV_026085 [Aristida adscensionis]
MTDSAGDLAVVVPEPEPGSFIVDGLDDFGLDDLDFDLAADEFCDAYAAFLADPGNKPGAGEAVPGGWLAGSGVGGGGGSREGSPDSSVTDGPLAGEEAMSAYVSELEQILMMDDDDGVDVGEVACPGDERAAEVTVNADEYFGDLLAKGDAAAANGVAAEEVTLNADDYFGDLLAKGDAAAANGAAAADKEREEDADLAAREDGTASRKRAS